MMQASPQIFTEGLNATPATPSVHLRRMSEISIQSTMSGLVDSIPLHTINSCKLRILRKIYSFFFFFNIVVVFKIESKYGES